MKKLIAIILAVVGLTVATPSIAGAAPEPCPWGDSGWFWAGDKVYHCVADGNHVVLDRYSKATGQLEQLAAIEWWQPGWVLFTVFPNWNGGLGYIRFCANAAGHDLNWGINSPPGWDRTFWITGPSFNGTEGVSNLVQHFDEYYVDSNPNWAQCPAGQSAPSYIALGA